MDTQEQRDLEEALVLMSRSVRDKLDRVGIKLHLAEWQALTIEERTQLRDQACGSAPEIERYRSDLEKMVLARCDKAVSKIPPARR